MADLQNMIRKGGDPVLKQICEPVAAGEALPWLESFKRVCRKVRNPSAAGLAAPQFGYAKRVILTNVADSKGTIRLRVMINPFIVKRADQTAVQVEGCLSYPGKSKAIRRAVGIDVVWEDERRNPMRGQFVGFEARVVQHEIDHLDGICRVGDDSPADVAEQAA